VEVAGLVVARQRPATARGVVFMLLEDESGVANVVVLPPAYHRHRLAVRSSSYVRVAGKLERREGVINVVADRIEALSTPDMAAAEVKTIEPPVERETGRREAGEARLPATGTEGPDALDLAAVAPRPHSFGKRG
jgi:error-prone DNA polymerase